MLARMLGAARLNVATFEDVEHDTGATLQAMLVVIFVSIATGARHSVGRRGRSAQGIWFSECCSSLLSWAVWALCGLVRRKQNPRDSGIPRQIGVSWLGAPGFAQTPGILKVFIFIPVVGLPLLNVVAFVVAVCCDGDCGTAELGLYVDPPSLCRGPHLINPRDYH